jgi:integrase
VSQSDATPTPTRKHLPGLGSIYLRGRTWHIEYWNGGQQFRETSKSQREKDAVKLLKKRHGELARDEFVGPQNDKILMKALLDGVTQDYKLAGNRSQDTLAFRLAPLSGALGHLRAVNVTEPLIERYKARRLEEGLARATVNRELAALRRAFRLAVEQKRMSPSRVPTIRLFPEHNARAGFVDYDDFTALVKHLPGPVDDVAWFAYRSGWRRGEILSLVWADVNEDAGVVRLRAELSKSKEPRELPLTPAIKQILERRWQARLVSTKQGPRVCDMIFHRDGKPVQDFRAAWDHACEQIGQPTLLFHDLRRSAVRNMVNAGVPERVAMRITGHKTRAVFDRYHIVSNRDVRDALERTEAALALDPHKSIIFPHNPSGQGD